MAFWSQPTLEPLRSFRGRIVFGGDGNLDAVSFALKKFDRPTAKVEEVSHQYLNHEFHYPGRLKWEPVNVTLVATKDENTTNTTLPTTGTSAKLMKILEQSGYQIPENVNQLKTISKDKFTKQVGKTISIQALDPEGNASEIFILHNPFFTNVKFGSFDYSSEELMEVEVTLRYDFSTLNGVTRAGV